MNGWFLSMLGMSAQAAVLVALIMVVRRLAGSRLHPSVMYGLWFLVIARLLLPLNFESAWSLPVGQDRGALRGIAGVLNTGAVGAAATSESASDQAALSGVASSAGNLLGRYWLVWLWGAGAAMVAVLLMRNAVAVRALVRGSRVVHDVGALRCLDECRRVAGVRSRPELRRSAQISTPALVGLRRPVILLPESVMERATPEELRFVYLHELVHYRRGDLWWNLLASLLVVAHWFNPLLWYGFACMRRDRETSCDAEVLRLAQGADSAQGYGRALLRLAELRLHDNANSFPMAIGIMETQTSTRRRITMISQYRKRAWRDMGWAVCIAGLLGMAGFTRAQQQELKPFELVTESGAVINALEYATSVPLKNPTTGDPVMSGNMPFTLTVDEAEGELIYSFDETTQKLETIKAIEGVTFAADGTTLTCDLLNYTVETSALVASGERLTFSMPDGIQIVGKELNWNVKDKVVNINGGIMLYQRPQGSAGTVTTTGGDSVEINLTNRQMKIRGNLKTYKP